MKNFKTTQELLTENLALRKQITRLEYLREEFQFTELTYRQILDAINDMVLVKGPGSKIMWANKAFRDYYGMTNSELQNMIDAPFNDPDYTEQYLKDDEFVFTTGKVLNIPCEPVTNCNGNIRYFHTVKSPILDPNGKVARLVAVCRDITKERHTKALIREGERRWQAIFDQAPTGIAILDSLSGQFQHINKRYCDIVGFPLEEMLALSFKDITYPDDLPPDLENMQKLLSGKIRTFQMEKRYIRKDGALIWVNLTCVPLWLDENDPRQHIAIVEDITERKKYEAMLIDQQGKLKRWAVLASKAQERERQRIALGLHDEIGQILATLKLRLRNSREQKDVLITVGQIKDINHLLDEAIRATRSLTFELGSPILYNLGLLAALQSLVEKTSERHPDIQFIVEICQEPPNLEMEIATIIYRAIQELLRNIEKHAHPQTVTLRVTKDKNYLCITVEDDGAGFPVVQTLGENLSLKKFGLFSINEQLKSIGGAFEIQSIQGKGTQAIILAPL
ncbi:PAS domain S-box protein [Candidatus Nitronereus thalassa]|uniref:PAS domain S-box protein n=1 Tax=Candidatus Nitronereus thalassa TaxID=3020898 RepID=A0ABU3K728_9BACT|nr:PAS domain S-box protein [Candidatus Nitronereus thalassa]MDT7042211.1 PAS domain S-box protein [Candidatus Nitronereus thalassa]